MRIVITKPAVTDNQRTCAMCGLRFDGPTNAQFCGAQCRSRSSYARRLAKADLTCATCSGPMAKARTSRPQGSAICRPCRRAAHGLLPDQSVNAAKAGGLLKKDKPAADCKRCGALIPATSRRWKFCSEECLYKTRLARGFGRTSNVSSGKRGYGRPHARLRAELLPLAYGTPCHFCGDLMKEGQDLHLDHTEDRSGYRGMTHASCNLRDGARRAGKAARLKRVREGWRPGQDPSTRRRSSSQAA